MTIQGTVSVDRVKEKARCTARHMVHDHPVADRLKHEIESVGVRRRNRLSYLPRLWHWRKVYAYRLRLYHPLWLVEDGVIYREYEDAFGNSFFMIAEIELRDSEGLQNIFKALERLDPCSAM